MTFNELEQLLSKGRIAPAYLLYGSECYFIRLLVDKIRDVYRAETGAEAERFSARGLDVVSVIDGLKTLPMWSKGRLVIIGEAERLKDEAREMIEGYVDAPSASSVLVLVGEKFDGRLKLAKKIQEKGIVVEVKGIYEKDVPYWVRRECASKGLNISHEAAGFMAELIGTDLSAMADAVEKISLYVGKKRLVDIGDVETVLSDTSKKTVFNLTDAIGMRDLARAEDMLENLLRNNEQPMIILAMISRHIRFLLKAKELLEKSNIAERDLSRELGVHWFFAKEYAAQSKMFTMEKLKKGIRSLWDADIRIKSSKLPKSAILHNLIVELVG